MHAWVGGDDGGRLVTRDSLKKKASGAGAKGQGEGPARSQWLRYRLHNLTWGHYLLLIITYEGFVHHLVILSSGVIYLDMNQGYEPWNEPRIRPNSLLQVYC